MSELMTADSLDWASIRKRKGLHLRFPIDAMRALVLVLADCLSLLIAETLFRIHNSVPRLVLVSSDLGTRRTVDAFIILGFIFIVSRYLAGDYTRRQLFWERARSTTFTIAILAVPCLALVVAMPSQYSLSAELGTWIFVLLAIPAMRHTAKIAMANVGLWRIPTALISSCNHVSDIYQTLSSNLSLGYDVCWLALENSDFEPPQHSGKLKRIVQFEPRALVAKLVAEGCEQAVVATDDLQSTTFAETIQCLIEAGMSVSFIPSFRRLPLVGTTTSFVFGKDIMLCQIHRHLQRRPNRLLKRSFDIAGTLGLLFLFMPVFAVLALCIKLHDRGPVFYAQRRVGLGGKQFRCMKFRSMAIDADARLEQWKIANPELYREFLKTYKLPNDPRITKPGEWIRKTSLDELPQLINVLRGEMSLVGPRPIPEQQLREQYGQAAKIYQTVRPGLTGLWQVSGRNDTSLEDRVYLDEWYILNWTFWYDLVILLQTAWVVVSRRGAY